MTSQTMANTTSARPAAAERKERAEQIDRPDDEQERREELERAGASRRCNVTCSRQGLDHEAAVEDGRPAIAVTSSQTAEASMTQAPRWKRTSASRPILQKLLRSGRRDLRPAAPPRP